MQNHHIYIMQNLKKSYLSLKTQKHSTKYVTPFQKHSTKFVTPFQCKIYSNISHINTYFKKTTHTFYLLNIMLRTTEMDLGKVVAHLIMKHWQLKTNQT